MEPGTGMIDDLASLSVLDEKTLLEELRIRYSRDIIYTYIGDILVAINPYKKLLIYSKEYAQKYTNIELRSQLSPHLFAISDKAYQRLRRTGLSQCCVVSGESGAGKTESTKLMVEHIVGLCKTNHTDLHNRIIQVNPLLEAFGNAQTMMNNNSSRFGKFIELKFAAEGHVIGGKIEYYLLEKSRVVSQGKGEKNFHIFYYMFAGLSDVKLQSLMLDRPDKHRILRTKDNTAIYRTDAELKICENMLHFLQKIMKIVGFSEEDMDMVFALLAAILHLGDITFENDTETDGVYIVDEYSMQIAAMLLGVSPEDLASALISNVATLRGERIVSLKNLDQANDGRDAIAKTLYARLFGWIVRQINFLLKPNIDNSQVPAQIGILDIAGFENFQTNSFEQLCINVANEQLQYYFNQHIFAWELEEYSKEGITGKKIKFTNNRPLLDMFLEKPLGIFSLLDEESRFPRATEQSFLEKLKKNIKSPMLVKPKGRDLGFGIIHYAGQVVYHVQGFLQKNRDTMSSNLVECLKGSESQIIADLFSAQLTDIGTLQLELNSKAPKRSRRSILLCKPTDVTVSSSKSFSRSASRKIKERMRKGQIPVMDSAQKMTVGTQFKNSLADLMQKLLEAEPQFVRCIKPNNYLVPENFHPNLVMQQLSYTGVLETTRIRRLGYPTRLPLHIFVQRYRFIAFPALAKVDPIAVNCYKILNKANLHDWQIGKTKVFLKYWHSEQLDICLDRCHKQVLRSQCYIRGWMARRRARSRRQLAQKQYNIMTCFLTLVEQAGQDKFESLRGLVAHDQIQFEKKMKSKREEDMKKKKKEDKKKKKDKQMKELPFLKVAAPQTLSPENRKPEPLPTESMERLYMNDIYENPMTPSPQGAVPVRMGLRRTPVEEVIDPQYQYASTIMHKHVRANGSNPYDYNEVSHYRRQMAPKKPDSATFYHELLLETLDRLPEIGRDIWSKVIYMERDQKITKFYIKEAEISVTGETREYDGTTIGLGGFDNPFRDDKISSIRERIGPGLRIRRDNEGSIWATKICAGEVVVKGYNDPGNHSLSEDVIKQMGRIQQYEPVKIFDMKEFKSSIALEMNSPEPNKARLQKMCIIAISFLRNPIDDMETPCWICIVNFAALDALQDQELLDEVSSIVSGIPSSSDSASPNRRVWAKLAQKESMQRREPLRKQRIELRNNAKQVGDHMNYSWEEDYYSSPNNRPLTLQGASQGSVIGNYARSFENLKVEGDQPLYAPAVRRNWAKIKVLPRDQSNQ